MGNMSELCCACLKKYPVKFVDIFSKDMDGLKYKTKLESLLSNQNTKQLTKDMKMCMQCIEKLQSSYAFQVLCIQSNKALENYMNIGQTDEVSDECDITLHTTDDDESKDIELVKMNFCCQKCKQIFKSKQELYFHEKIHEKSSVVQLQCSICNKVYSDKFSLSTHVCKPAALFTSNTPTKRPSGADMQDIKIVFKCSHCDEHFPSEYELNVHKSKHRNDKDNFIKTNVKQNEGTDLKDNEMNVQKQIPNLVKLSDEEIYKSIEETKLAVQQIISTNNDMPITTLDNETTYITMKDLQSDSNLKVQETIKNVIIMRNTRTNRNKIIRNIKLDKHTISNNKTQEIINENMESINQAPRENTKPHSDKTFPIKCDDCNRILNSKERTSNSRAAHKCKKCSAKNTRKLLLEKPLENQHRKSKTLVCNYCQKQFKQVYLLRNHITIHTGEKNFECDLCYNRFAYLSTLNRHRQAHKNLELTGKKSNNTPFLCNVCGKTFPFSNGYQRHMRTHLGLKPFECTVCKKKFAQSTHLKVHMRTHTGEKPYCCAVCGELFSLNASLRKHYRTQHSEHSPNKDVKNCSRKKS